MSVIYAFIDRAFKNLTEPKMGKMFFKPDQPIYSKLLDAMFKMSEDGHDMFSKLTPRMGRFHIIMCMLKTIFSRFIDSGIIKLNENKRASYYGSIKKERSYHFKLSKRKPGLQFLVKKVSQSVKFSSVLKVKN